MFLLSSGWYSLPITDFFCVDRKILFNMVQTVQTLLSIIFVLTGAIAPIFALPLPSGLNDDPNR
jgi:hypothetical protein